MWLHTYANTRFIYGINAFALMTISFLTLIISGLTQETLNTLGAMGYQTTEFENPTPIINPYFITSILIIITLFITFKLSKIQSWEIDVRYDFWKNIQTFLIKNSLFFRSTLISVFFLWVGSREILVSIDNSGLQQIMLSLYWTIFSVTILSLGILKRKFRVRLISYGLLCIPIIKMFLYDAWLAEPIFGFLGLFLFGCFLLSTAFIYQKNKTRIQEFLTKVLTVLSLVAGFLATIGYLVVLFTGTYPRGLFDFQVGMSRWNFRINCWLIGLTDKYPPFSFQEGDYPADVSIEYPESSSRLLAFLGLFFLKMFVLIPHSYSHSSYCYSRSLYAYSRSLYAYCYSYKAK